MVLSVISGSGNKRSDPFVQEEECEGKESRESIPSMIGLFIGTKVYTK